MKRSYTIVLLVLLASCAPSFQTVALFDEIAYHAVNQVRLETNAVVDTRSVAPREVFSRSLYSRAFTTIAQAKEIYQSKKQETNSIGQLGNLSDAIEAFIVLDSSGAKVKSLQHAQNDIHEIDSLIEATEFSKLRPK